MCRLGKDTGNHLRLVVGLLDVRAGDNRIYRRKGVVTSKEWKFEYAEMQPDRECITRSRKTLPIKDASMINHMKDKLRAKIKGESS
jgi:hypothetical protein